MDKIKFDDELVDVDKVKSLIIDMLNKSERIPYVNFKSDNLELCPDELEYKYTYADNELSTIFYKILIDKELSSKSNESEAIVKVFFENNMLDNTSVFSFMFRIDTHDKSDEWFEYY